MNDSVPAPTKRDLRKANTRGALLRAAESLFAERGPDGVSVDDVTKTAGVAKGSFYNYFTDKDDLSAALDEILIGDLFNAFEAAAATETDPAKRIQAAMTGGFLYVCDHPGRAAYAPRLLNKAASVGGVLLSGFRRDVDAGLAAGQFTKVAPAAAALMIVGALQAGFAPLIDSPSPLRARALARELGALTLRALGLGEG